MNKQNVLRLASHLAHGKLVGKFDMSVYTRQKKLTALVFQFSDLKVEVTCTTVACALCHATTVFGPARLQLTDILSSWRRWGTELFEMSPEQFDFAFHGNWASVDNTPLGAAKRLIALIERPEFVGRIKSVDMERTKNLYTTLVVPNLETI